MQRLENQVPPALDDVRMRLAAMLLQKKTPDIISQEVKKYGIHCTKSQLSHYITLHPIGRFEMLMAENILEVEKCR